MGFGRLTSFQILEIFHIIEVFQIRCGFFKEKLCFHFLICLMFLSIFSFFVFLTKMLFSSFFFFRFFMTVIFHPKGVREVLADFNLFNHPKEEWTKQDHPTEDREK